MAIPTQFSVTSKATSPIANPSAPQDLPKQLDAENVSIVDGAEVLSSLSSAAVDTPSALTSESGVTIPLPSELTARVQASIDTPSAASAESTQAIDTPTAATSESVAPIATPSTLTTVTGTLTTPPFPLNHARILYENRLEQLDSANSDIAGSTPINAIKPNTWERFNNPLGGNGYIRFDMSATRGIDTVCVGAHNAGSKSYNFIAYYRETLTGPLIQFSTGVTPDTDAPIMFHRSNLVSAKVIEVYFNGGSEGFSIGYISAGVALQMQRPFFNGHTPITDADATQYYSNRTESGEIIGQQIRRQGFETSADWQNIDDTWYRTYFAPFKQAIKTKPFFFAWNLLEYPEDVGFCRVSQDVSAPMQNGTVTKRSISMNLLGAG